MRKYVGNIITKKKIVKSNVRVWANVGFCGDSHYAFRRWLYLILNLSLIWMLSTFILILFFITFSIFFILFSTPFPFYSLVEVEAALVFISFLSIFSTFLFFHALMVTVRWYPMLPFYIFHSLSLSSKFNANMVSILFLRLQQSFSFLFQP